MKPKVLLLCNFAGINLEKLREVAANIDCSQLLSFKSVDEKFCLKPDTFDVLMIPLRGSLKI